MTLKKHIQTEIATEGPMPFERFMELALYHPEGFFGGNTLRSEKAGDFLTSPEVSSAFGETLGSYVAREHKRIGDPFTLIEVAAGSGSLLRPLLKTHQVRVMAVEVSPAAQASLTESIPGIDLFADISEIPKPLRGVVLANELIDNLPMAVAQRVDGGWRERYVGVEGDALVFVDALPRAEVADWLARFAGDVPDGGWVEAQIAAAVWLEATIAALDSGSIVLIDYGDTTEGLLPRRQDGTLRTYRSHHLGPHPLDEPGETDITADVNFSALQTIAKEMGAQTQLIRQDDFLSELGLRDRLSTIRHNELEAARSGNEMERLKLRTLKTEIETLLHPRGLGDFRVLIVTV